MSIADHVVLFAYLAGSVALGAWFTRRQRGERDFFLAGREMSWFPIGLSVLATAFSSMNYAAFSGEVFRHGLYVVMCVPVFALVAVPVTRLFMPFYHGMRLTSAYEYLEKRFDVRVRCLASGLFILWRLAWMAVALFVPCKVLSLMTGWDLRALIVAGGLVATAYTVAGGMRAVMWTDVVQFFVLFGGIVVGVAVASARMPGGLTGLLRAGAEAGLARPFHPFDPQVLSPDPRLRMTVWSCLIGTFVALLSRYGADQAVVQRYFTARSLRDAQRGFWLNVAGATLALACLALFGFAIHAHAAAAGPGGPAGRMPIANVARFIAALPAGVCGLLMAGLFAASMSSVDSGVHSCSTAFLTDFHRRLFRRRGGCAGARLSRLLALGFGLVATAAACTVDQWGMSVFGVANRIINGLGSPLLALFLLGMFSRRANAPGLLVGGVLGTAWSVFVSSSVQGLALHYYAVVNLIGTLVLCYGLSLLFGLTSRRPTPEQLAWTWRERRRAGMSA